MKKINLKNAAKFKPIREALTFEEAVKEANRCILCKDAPCSQGCPAGTDPGKFIRQIKFENYKGAARTIRNNNCLGTICAIVCPVEKLCEKECTAKVLDDPINIGGLQHFACEYGKKHGLEKLTPSKKDKGKIAIIGAGPAGLSCAYELAKMDYDVTVFEQKKTAGGVPRQEIPGYRLSPKIINSDLQKLSELGITFKFNYKINLIQEVKVLLNQYDAIFIGIGLAVPKTMPVFDGYKNAITSKQFLQNIKNKKNQINVKDKYVIITGGGSVAMDVAGTARALGAKKVTVVYRRTENEMPADNAEKELAKKLGVEFKTEATIDKVSAKNKKITFIHGTDITWKKPGSRNPKDAKPIAGAEFTLKTDWVIQAIGANPIADFPAKMKGVFYGGDLVNKGQTVVQAVGEGKQAAINIDTFIQG